MRIRPQSQTDETNTPASSPTCSTSVLSSTAQTSEETQHDLVTLQIQKEGSTGDDHEHGEDTLRDSGVSQKDRPLKIRKDSILLLREYITAPPPQYHPSVPRWLYDLCTKSLSQNLHPDGSYYHNHKFMVHHHYYYYPNYRGPCLDLRSQRLGDESAKIIAWALKTNTTLVGLDLSWNDIGNEGAEALADVLQVVSVLPFSPSSSSSTIPPQTASSPPRRRQRTSCVVGSTDKAGNTLASSPKEHNPAHPQEKVREQQHSPTNDDDQQAHNRHCAGQTHVQEFQPPEQHNTTFASSSSSLMSLGLAVNRIGNRGAIALAKCLWNPHPSTTTTPGVFKSMNVSLKMVWLPGNEMVDDQSKSELIHASLNRSNGFQFEI